MHFSDEVFANNERTHIRGGPELSLLIRRLARASPLVPLFECLIGKHENATLAIKPGILVDIFHWRLCSICHSQKFVVAVCRLFSWGR